MDLEGRVNDELAQLDLRERRLDEDYQTAKRAIQVRRNTLQAAKKQISPAFQRLADDLGLVLEKK